MTKIEWTDATWNPTTGCDKVSQGCKNCYAEVMHKRLMGMFPEKYSKPFLGHVQIHTDELFKPINRKKPTWYFVNSMSDLFHEQVPFDFIDNVFAVMDCCPQHTFQILTKHPDRMLQYLREERSWRVGQLKVSYNSSDYDLSSWPLNNVLLGTSAEDQDNYNKRIAAMFFIKQMGWSTMLSAEPLIGPLRLFVRPGDLGEKIFDWVIVGGESGHKARPMHPQWVRNLRDECHSSGIPFFFKQWGEFQDGSRSHCRNVVVMLNGRVLDYDARPKLTSVDWNNQLPRVMAKVGKSQSGNELDGKQYLEFPTTSNIQLKA